jgi:hypothetical protein
MSLQGRKSEPLGCRTPDLDCLDCAGHASKGATHCPDFAQLNTKVQFPTLGQGHFDDHDRASALVVMTEQYSLSI